MFTLLTSEKTQEVYLEVVAYLKRRKIHIPNIQVNFTDEFAGSFFEVDEEGNSSLNLGNYLTKRQTSWFVMHEVAHLLFTNYQEACNTCLVDYFEEPQPDNYLRMSRRYSAFMDSFRPDEYPSLYGKYGGGEERFCELLAYMYCNGGFESDPPEDLAPTWDTCKQAFGKMKKGHSHW